MSKSLKKLVEESREKNQPEVDMSDRGISSMLDVNGLFSLAHITQLVLSHNKLTSESNFSSVTFLLIMLFPLEKVMITYHFREKVKFI
ncbi:ras suppressor protein 1 isoform 9 [Mus musculus]|uniref:ras suppressor protein 1 isoform 9 n=1 Tax=Mus musculus TaxID=10090 RepID=UPI002486C691|nr:ras suppressor protein 1 isoform 9 [Mus musculus]